MLEGSTSLGGMLRGAEVAGVTVDVGAEAMLNRRPEGVALARSWVWRSCTRRGGVLRLAR
ncbi:MAG: hypothetical protein R2731_06200 [Nocardioides sp.]